MDKTRVCNQENGSTKKNVLKLETWVWKHACHDTLHPNIYIYPRLKSWI
jgi:hypothetical protein